MVVDDKQKINLIKAYIDVGSNLTKLKRYKEAIKIYDTALKESGNELTINYRLFEIKGNLYFILKDYKSALKEYYKANSVSPKESNKVKEIKECLVKLNRIPEAIRYLNKFIKLHQNNPDGYLTLGNLYFENEQYELAMDSYKKLLGMEPQSEQALANIAAALNSLGNFTEAKQYCQEALDINPKYSETYRIMAFSLNHLKRYQDAIEVANKALELDKTNIDACFEITYALIALGKYEDALKICKQAISFDAN